MKGSEGLCGGGHFFFFFSFSFWELVCCVLPRSINYLSRKRQLWVNNCNIIRYGSQTIWETFNNTCAVTMKVIRTTSSLESFKLQMSLSHTQVLISAARDKTWHTRGTMSNLLDTRWDSLIATAWGVFPDSWLRCCNPLRRRLIWDQGGITIEELNQQPGQWGARARAEC